MSKEITITLRQVRESGLCMDSWNKVLKENGGKGISFDKPFPLSGILGSNGLDDTLQCFTVLSEYLDIVVDFAIFCAKEASTHTDDKRVHTCINMIEKYLCGDVSLEELLIAGDAADTASLGGAAYTARTYAAKAAADTVSLVTTTGDDVVPQVSYALDAVVCATIHAATNAVTCNYGDMYTAEVHKQTKYLRTLLNGKIKPRYKLP